MKKFCNDKNFPTLLRSHMQCIFYVYHSSPSHPDITAVLSSNSHLISSQLRELTLEWVTIRSSSRFLNSLSSECSRLQHLWLYYCNITGSDYQQIIRALINSNITKFTSLYIPLDDADGRTLVELLKVSKTLKYVRVDYKNMSIETCIQLMTAMNHSSVEELVLAPVFIKSIAKLKCVYPSDRVKFGY